MNQQDPIRIAGAGLSGLSAAIGLAQQGHVVDVFEKNADSGESRRGHWDAMENWTTEEDVLELLCQAGIAADFEHRPISNIDVYAGNGARYSVSVKQPLCYLVKRGPEQGSLEYALKSQALRHGVNIHYSQPRTRDAVDVWAAGCKSGGFFLGAGLAFRTTHPDVVMCLVDTFAAPKAYAYLVIVDGQGTLTTVLTRDFIHARQYLDRSTEFFRQTCAFNMEDVHMSSGFGGALSAFWQPVTNPIVVGEAGGFQDFLWGFGIRHALFSGQLAARAIHERLDYERLVSREIRPSIRSSLVNRAIYDHLGNPISGRVLQWFSSSPALPRLLRWLYRASTPRNLLWPAIRYGYIRFHERKDSPLPRASPVE